MSLSVNTAAANFAASAQQAPPSPGHAASAPVQVALPIAADKAPAIKAPPLVDPEQMRENLHSAIEKLNQQIERNGRGLNFALDERLNRPIITVRNTSTGEIVRTIPNEVVIKVAHNIEDIKGLLMDQRL